MLPKSQRLTTEDFKDFRGSSTSHSAHFLFRVKRAAPPATTRMAAVVSSAVAKTAVMRNLMRRRIYEVLAKEALSSPPPLLITVTAKKGAPALSFQAVRAEIHAALLQMPSLR